MNKAPCSHISPVSVDILQAVEKLRASCASCASFLPLQPCIIVTPDTGDLHKTPATETGLRGRHGLAAAGGVAAQEGGGMRRQARWGASTSTLELRSGVDDSGEHNCL